MAAGGFYPTATSSSSYLKFSQYQIFHGIFLFWIGNIWITGMKMSFDNQNYRPLGLLKTDSTGQPSGELQLFPAPASFSSQCSSEGLLITVDKYGIPESTLSDVAIAFLVLTAFVGVSAVVILVHYFVWRSSPSRPSAVSGPSAINFPNLEPPRTSRTAVVSEKYGAL